jgi:ketosteroid isomerase-like protein
MDIPTPGSGTAFELKIRFRDTAGLGGVARRNREAIMGAYEALAAGNVEAWWSVFDPDVAFYEAACLPYGGTHRGLEAAKKANAGIFEAYDWSEAVIEDIAASGDMTIAYLQFTCRGKATGKTTSFPIAELYRFRDGKVVEWRACYFDVTLALDVLGLKK